jgi:hypothetical protein
LREWGCRLAGYPPCLAATATLKKAGLLEEDVPGKTVGLPGNAFSLVYDGVANKVYKRLYTLDGVLGEWIRYRPQLQCFSAE